ncbi:hypothetical protein [Marinomonas primoryensis]|uniref:Uncharacterized protein n=1 Tax=Marinomonas primoryensis TaxID=178399 RepID=A0ABV0L528_9GAMM|tara:strand:+ start:95 stop:589 length:495 start_codon:yes stop_codon:yes gene_type:complete
MMLKVTSSKEVGDVNIDMGGYTPLISEFHNEKSSIPIYWRVGDFESSLIEVGLNKNSGCILSVSLLMFDSVSDVPFVGSSDLAVEVGMPIFDIEGWPEDGSLDIQSYFRVFKAEDRLRLMFSDELKPVKIYRNKTVDFCISEMGELIWIEFLSLVESELLETFS